MPMLGPTSGHGVPFRLVPCPAVFAFPLGYVRQEAASLLDLRIPLPP